MDKHTLEAAVGIALAASAAAVGANAALRPQSQLFGSTLVAGPDPSEAALTYDDGPNERCTEALLELLARHDAKATFFMIGRFVRQRPDLARKVHEAGHLVANHTMTHPWLVWSSARRIEQELRDCQSALQDATGVPVRYFRPPHGARRPYVLRAAEALGLTTVQWNAMGKDWKPIAAATVVAKIDADIARIRPRRASNILLHDGGHEAMGVDRSETLKATAILLDRFQQQGIQPVRVDAWATAMP